MTNHRNARRLLALAAVAAMAPSTSDAWVAVRAGPGLVGAAAVGVAAGAVAGAAASNAYRYSAPPPSTVVVQAPPAPAAVGTVVTTLPSGCVTSGNRYQCGSVWYQPYFGGNGVYYQVVAP